MLLGILAHIYKIAKLGRELQIVFRIYVTVMISYYTFGTELKDKLYIQ